ncbi:MAG: hypothetical protein ACYSWS_05840, partial [Planctomycetota bacterium]
KKRILAPSNISSSVITLSFIVSSFAHFLFFISFSPSNNRLKSDQLLSNHVGEFTLIAKFNN